MLCVIFRAKSLACTNAFNATLCFATGPFWGFLFDWVLFSDIPDIFVIIGAIFITYGAYLNSEEGEKIEDTIVNV